MVDCYLEEESYNDFQQRWVDYLDADRNEVLNTIAMLKDTCSAPWCHPNENMVWLWDYCLELLAEDKATASEK